MPNVNKQYFLDLMAGRNLSMRNLAAKLGMKHSQLSLTFSGVRRMTLDEASQLSSVFGVALHEIVMAAGVSVRPAKGRRVNVVGFVGREGVVTVNPKDVVERTDAVPDLPESCVAIQFRTGDTPLSWMDTWIVFFSPIDVVSPDALGRFSVCKIKDGPIVVATPKRGYREGTFNLTGPSTQESVVLDWATPLLLCRF
jgi:hypothetical protein